MDKDGSRWTSATRVTLDLLKILLFSIFNAFCGTGDRQGISNPVGSFRDVSDEVHRCFAFVLRLQEYLEHS